MVHLSHIKESYWDTMSESESHSVMSDSLRPLWNSPGQIPGVGSLSLLQGIFPTQGSNPGLLHCRWVLYQLSHKGTPRILEWVAYPFSRGSCWTRNWTWVSCTAGRFFTVWTTWEAFFPSRECEKGRSEEHTSELQSQMSPRNKNLFHKEDNFTARLV